VLNLKYIPVPLKPYLARSANPANIVYADPKLAPGGAGGAPTAPEIPPSVSAYTGLDGDVPPPPGMGPPGVPLPTQHFPFFPTPALYPGASVPTPEDTRIGPPQPPPASAPLGTPSLPGLLLPSTDAPPPPAPGPPLPAEETPPS
jgi:phospholipid/cholesterol/gamma-HCH transport system substrate-binding protein